MNVESNNDDDDGNSILEPHCSAANEAVELELSFIDAMNVAKPTTAVISPTSGESQRLE
jgi:hypothetical protein